LLGENFQEIVSIPIDKVTTRRDSGVGALQSAQEAESHAVQNGQVVLRMKALGADVCNSYMEDSAS